MNNEMVISIIYNIALLLSLGIIYVILPPNIFIFKGKRIKLIFAGCIVGIVGIGIMCNPFELFSGIVFDVRSILVSLTGIFMGIVPTAIAAVIIAVFRIYQGGGGAWTGVAVILFSAVFGLIWRYFRFEKITNRNRHRFIELYLFGILTHIGMLAIMFTLPWSMAVNVLKNISIPVMVVYPVGTVLVGMLLLRQIDSSNIVAQLDESEQRYRSLFSNNHAVMLLINPEGGQIVDANPAACTYYGWSLEELRNKKISEINILTDEEINAEMRLAVSEKRNHFHFKHRLSSRVIRDVEAYSSPIKIRGQEILYSIIHDVTKRRITQSKLKESEERLRVTLLSVGDAVITTDKEGNITLINKTAKQVTGWTTEVIGQPINSVFHIVNEYTRKKVEDPVQKVLATGNIIGLANHTVLICPDGIEKPIADSAAPIKDDYGNILGVVLVIRDVTEERKKQQRISYLGYHDGLTGLYNRSFLDAELKRLDVERNLPISIIIGDVNGLKITNDAFGHAVGDKLLINMANEIKSACRKDDIVARWGGDEFFVLLPKTDESSAETICNRIKENCAKVKMSDVNFSISLGVDTKRNNDQNINTTIKSAEDYMYRKKSFESMSTRGNTINTILLTLYEKNKREQSHSNRVSELCKGIGQAMNLSQKEVSELEILGLMHDIGKIAISDIILTKKSKLDQDEWNEIKKHPEIGFRILSASNSMAYIANYVLKHHERLDGLGYPNGIKAEEIPMQSRILSIADSFDAMTHERPYEEKMTEESAIKELMKYSSTRFDSEIVKVFIEKVINHGD